MFVELHLTKDYLGLKRTYKSSYFYIAIILVYF